MSCPATGLKDFPIQNTVTVTETLNQSVLETSQLEFQWGKRGTVPQFQTNYLTEGIYNSGDQTTTLRIRGNSYTLKFCKLSEPLHSGFLTAADKTLAIGEVLMVFQSAAALTETFVFVCIPIVNKTTTTPSPYLESIRLDRLPGRPIGLDDLLPSSKNYISYTTCLHQVTQGKTNPIQANVLVFTGGLPYATANLLSVRRKMNSLPLPSPLPPNSAAMPPLGPLAEGLVAKTNQTLFLLTSENDYRQYIRFSTLASSSSKSEDSGRRVDSTNAYKCVPLKPDINVKDNKIIIDTDKGVPLSQILDEKAEDQGLGKITPGMVERMIAIVLGSAAGIFILSVFAYIFSRVTSDNTDANFPWLVNKTKDLLPMVFVSIVVGIIGFLIGFFTSTT